MGKSVGAPQRSFAGGEVTPSVGARSDTVKHQTGAKTLRNWFVMRHGGAANRAGTQYVATAKDAHDDVRVVAWRFNDDQTYMLEFGEYYIRVYQDGGAVVTGAVDAWSATTFVPGDITYVDLATDRYFYCVATHTGNDGTNHPVNDIATSATNFWYELTLSGASALLEIPTPFAQADLGSLVFAQSADVVTITHRDYPPHELVRTSNTNWTCLPVRFAPSMTAPTGIAVGAANGTGSNNKVQWTVTAVKEETFEESMGGVNSTTYTDKTIDTPVAGNDLNVNHTAVNTVLSTGDEVYITVVETQSATRAHENAVRALQDRVFTVTVDAGNNDFTLDGTAGLLTDPTISTSYPPIQIDWGLAYLQLTVNTPSDPSTNSDNVKITWTAVADAEEYRVYRRVDDGPWGFLSSTRLTSYTDGGDREPDTEEAPPRYRAPFVANNWPRTTGYYQQRQVYASTDDNPQKVWESVTGDFRNFSTRSPVGDDDAVEFTVAGAEANEIEHVTSLGQMILHTSGAIWTARGDADGVIKPTAINLEALSYEGSSSLKPLLVGDSVLYVEARGSIVRELRFDLGTGGFSGFVGRDLTVFAAHLFDGHSIVSWAYAAVPHSIVWACRDDGVLLGLTYLKEHDIWAWHQHTTAASGEFLSVAVIPESSVDIPYFVVKRTINGSSAYYIERMKPRTVGEAGYDGSEDAWFVDSGLSSFDSAVSSVSGLDHLEAETVAVLADGNPLTHGTDGANLVVTSGAITLSTSTTYTDVIAGLAIPNADLEMLDLDIAAVSDALADKNKRVPSVTLFLDNTRGITIGPDSSNLKAIPIPPEDTATALISEKRMARLDGVKWNKGGPVLVRQAQPLPASVLAIIRHVEVADPGRGDS
jgi:hypothetical protein